MTLRQPLWVDPATSGIQRRMSSAAGDTLDPGLIPGLAGTRIGSFTGDGTTKAFALSVAVPASSTLSCLVFITGLLQRDTTDYSISGNTLTFIAAPPNGANLQVFYCSSTPLTVNALNQVTETYYNIGNTTGNFALDFSKGSVQAATLGAAGQMSFAGLIAGVSNTCTLYLTNGGAFALTYATTPKYSGGSANANCVFCIWRRYSYVTLRQTGQLLECTQFQAERLTPNAWIWNSQSIFRFKFVDALCGYK